MANLGIPELIKPFRSGPDKGQFRLKKVIDKIENGEPFKTKFGDKVLLYINEEIGKAIQEYDFKYLSGVKTQSWFKDFDDTKYKVSSLLKTNEFGGKLESTDDGKKGVDPHEIMTAAIIYKYGKNGKQFPSSLISRYSNDRELCSMDIERLKPYGSKVKGSKQIEVDSFTNDFDAYAQAISAANGFLKHLSSGSKVIEVHATGAAWGQEISKFAIKDHPLFGREHYNSSDLVVKTIKNGVVHWIGISLKKKPPEGADPTIINKTIVGMDGIFRTLVKRGEIPNKEIHNIYNQRSIFFANVIKKALASPDQKISSFARKALGLKNASEVSSFIKDELDPLVRKGGSFSQNKKILKFAQQLGQNNMTNALQRKYPDDSLENNYFKALDSLMTNPKYSASIVISLINIIFKTDLKNILTQKKLQNFHFTLITGKGEYKMGDFIVKDADELQEAYTTEILTYLTEDSKKNKGFFISKTPGKKQAFEGGPAKLFYSLYLGKFDVADIEIRYKGSITAEPQFFATITPKFKNTYKRYHSMIKKGQSAY
jgi:hypothetical protein